MSSLSARNCSSDQITTTTSTSVAAAVAVKQQPCCLSQSKERMMSRRLRSDRGSTFYDAADDGAGRRRPGERRWCCVSVRATASKISPPLVPSPMPMPMQMHMCRQTIFSMLVHVQSTTICCFLLLFLPLRASPTAKL